MHSLRTKIVTMAVIMIVAVVLVVTVTSVLSMLLFFKLTGKRNISV